MYYVYLLFSEKDSGFYTGITKDIETRYKFHFNGGVTSTKYRRPLELIYYEAYAEPKDARGRELFLKSGSGRQFLKKQLKHWIKK